MPRRAIPARSGSHGADAVRWIPTIDHSSFGAAWTPRAWRPTVTTRLKLDLELILPESEGTDPCVERLLGAVRGLRGVVEAHLGKNVAEHMKRWASAIPR